MNQLNLKEQFLLLAIHDEKGIYVHTEHFIGLGVLSASIMDEVLAGSLSLENETVHIHTPPEISDPARRLLFKTLEENPKARTIKKIIQTLKIGDELCKLTLNSLVKKNILNLEEGKILWVFKQTKMNTENPIPELRLKQRLRTILIDKKPAEAREVMLLSLVQALNIFNEIFPERKERKAAKKAFKELKESNVIAGELGRIIEETTAMVIATTTALFASTSVIH